MARTLNRRRVSGFGSVPPARDGNGRWLGPALAISVGLWAMLGAGAILLARLV